MVLLTPSLAKETFTTLTGQGRQLKEGAARAIPLKRTGYSQILKRASSRLSLMNFVLRNFLRKQSFVEKGVTSMLSICVANHNITVTNIKY